MKILVPNRSDIARLLYVTYMRDVAGFPMGNEIPPPNTFPWKLADAVIDYLRGGES